MNKTHQPTHSPRPARPHTVLAALAAGCITVAAPAWSQVINEDLKLEASDGAGADMFGGAIAIDNGIVAVASINDEDNGSGYVNSGSVYLFDGSTGVQLFKLIAGDRRSYDFLGRSVAMDDGIVAVGANGDDDHGSLSGSAYLFDAATGVQLFKLVPSDGASDDQFGRSIAIAGGIVAVGATLDDDNGISSGSAYLFDASTGAQLFKLLASDGAQADYFGDTIAIGGGLVVVGAHSDDDNGDNSGSAYVFDASTGLQLFKLLAGDGDAVHYFGVSVAIDSGTIVVGAWEDDANGSRSGSAYLFDASTGAQTAKLLPSDGAMDDHFGEFVAIEGGVVAVAATGDNEFGFNSGSAYLFDASTGLQTAKLVPSDGADSDFFGKSIDIENGAVAVGAPFDDDPGTHSGAAYVFTAPAAGCPADLNGDGVVNTQDFILFLGAWANGDPLADWNGDGTVNTQDFIAYLGDWAAGC